MLLSLWEILVWVGDYLKFCISTTTPSTGCSGSKVPKITACNTKSMLLSFWEILVVVGDYSMFCISMAQHHLCFVIWDKFECNFRIVNKQWTQVGSWEAIEIQTRGILFYHVMFYTEIFCKHLFQNVFCVIIIMNICKSEI